MSEHPLERKIKDWLGSRPTFSTQFCTDSMRDELVDYFKSNDLSYGVLVYVLEVNLQNSTSEKLVTLSTQPRRRV